MIHVENGGFTYPNGRKVFEGVSFDVQRGNILCVMGGNGVGKTTLLKCVSGIYDFTLGKCIINKRGGLRPRMSYVPQAKKPELSYNMLDFVTFGRSVLHGYFEKPKPEDYETAERALDVVGMSSFATRSITKVSGGELQMAYIAKALVSDPEVLILDEPESNLDFKNQQKVVTLLMDLAAVYGTTIILNTHCLQYAARMADVVLLMEDGTHSTFGPADEVLKPLKLQSCFGVPIMQCHYEYEGRPEQSLLVR